MTELPSAFGEFIASSRVLIVDSSAPSRAALAQTLIQMGSKPGQIQMTGSLEEGLKLLQQTKPTLIFTEYKLGTHCGLELLKAERTSHTSQKEREAIFAVVTSNTSQAAVAHAAEEDADTFILKPYSFKRFRDSLLLGIMNKIAPTEYVKAIETGQSFFREGLFEESEREFKRAMNLHPAPALACYHLGQFHVLRKHLDVASKHYKKGLSYNRIHHGCLTGLFEVTTENKQSKEAYASAKQLVRYFPDHTKRLSSVLRLAVITGNYSDVEGYYRIFNQLSSRTEELTTHICSAMIVTAKHFLHASDIPRALAVFESLFLHSKRETRFLRYAVEALVEAGELDNGKKFLQKFPETSRSHEDYLTAELLIFFQEHSPAETEAKARKLLQAGQDNPLVYRILIECLFKSGSKERAEDMALQASRKCPRQMEVFLAVAQGVDARLTS